MDSVICSSCGAAMRPEARFCKSCGASAGGNVVFEKVWFLSEPRAGFDFRGIKSYDDIGTLTFTADSCRFRGRRGSVSIRDIQRISYGRQGRDFLNRWVKFDYGKGKTAYFADGSHFGWGGVFGGSKEIFEEAQLLQLSDDTEVQPHEGPTRESMKKELRGWGVSMISIAAIGTLLLGWHPVVGTVVFIIGALCLLIIRRGMFIVTGLWFFFGGLGAIFFQGIGLWTVLGLFLLYLGVREIRSFRKYAHMASNNPNHD